MPRTLGPNDRTQLAEALARSRGAFLAVGVFSFFINILMLTAPLYMLQVYDRVLTSRSVDTLLALTVLAAGLLLMNGLVEMARSRILVRVGAKLDTQLTDALFAAVLAGRLRGSEHGTSQPMRDLETLRMFLTGNGLIALFDSPWTPMFIALIFLFHPLLGAIALGGAIVLFTLALLTELLTRRPLGDAGQASASAYQFVDRTLRNAEVIQAMGMASGLRRNWLSRHRHGLARQAVASDRAGTLNAMVKVMRMSLQIAMLGAGAWLAIQNIISPGVMIAGSIIMGRALAPVEAAIANWRNVVGARSAYHRLQDLLEENPAGAERMALPAPAGRLAVEAVSARPPRAKALVLQGVSFALEPGELLGLVGPSAAGKSTLARVLVGVWPAVSGSVRLDGADIADWDRERLGPHIGYLPQDVELFDGTVGQNIARFGDPDPERIVAAARMADAHEMILRLSDGYDTPIGDGGGALSGGQRQRIGLARAVYGEPAFVVLDEPNANLDHEGEEALRAALKRLKDRERTVVIISHRPSVLAFVDKLLVLRDGRVDAFGPRAEVMRKITETVAKSATAGKARAAAPVSEIGRRAEENTRRSKRQERSGTST